MPIDTTFNMNGLAELERLAQRCTASIARCLEPGMTEKDAANLMRQWLHQHGIDDAMHSPLALFGERARLATVATASALPRLRPAHYPSDRKLRLGQAVTLYCAPRSQALVAESLHSTSVGSNADQRQFSLQLSHLKTLLLNGINQQLSLGELTHLINQLATTQGAKLSQHGLAGSWVRPYSSTPLLKTNTSGLLGKVVELSGSNAPTQLPQASRPLPSNACLSQGLWVIQPWLDNGQHAAGFRCLVYIDSNGKADWLADLDSQTEAA